MIILFFSSLSLAALAGLLALNSAALKAAKARQGRTAQEKLREIERNKLPNTSFPIGLFPIGLSPGRGDAKWINGAWVKNTEIARQEAIKAAEATQIKAERATWEKSPGGRVVCGLQTTLAWILAAPIVLLLLSPFILLFGLPVALIIAAIGFKLCCLIALVVWCLNDFQSGVADAVVEKMKK